MGKVRDDPDLHEDGALKVVTDSKIEVYQQKMNVFFTLMFGESGNERVVISKSFLSGCLNAKELSREDEEYFMRIFRYIRTYYNESPESFPVEERSFFLRTLNLRWRLGAPLNFDEFVKSVISRDRSADPLTINSLI